MREGSVLFVESRPATKELKKHTSELGERFVFVDGKNRPDARLYVVARVLKNVKSPYEPALPRKHTVDAVMLFLGSGKDLKGLKAEVNLGSEGHSVLSPSAVYIPAGTEHTYRVLRGSGIYLKIVLAKGGDYNSVTS